MNEAQIRKFSASQSESGNSLSLVWLQGRRGPEALLGQVGAAFKTDELLWLRSNVFEDDAQQLVSEIKDAHGEQRPSTAEGKRVEKRFC